MEALTYQLILLILLEREVGGNAAVVLAEQADGCPVVRLGGGFLGVIVSHRDSRLAQVGHLHPDSNSQLWRPFDAAKVCRQAYAPTDSVSAVIGVSEEA